MKHSEQALQWHSEGKTVLLAGAEVTPSRLSQRCLYWKGQHWGFVFFDAIVDAGLPLTYKEPEPKVKRIWVESSNNYDGHTYILCHVKGNVTEAQVKAALESIGEKQ